MQGKGWSQAGRKRCITVPLNGIMEQRYEMVSVIRSFEEAYSSAYLSMGQIERAR